MKRSQNEKQLTALAAKLRRVKYGNEYIESWRRLESIQQEDWLRLARFVIRRFMRKTKR